jgi:hypothetical protein
MSSKTQGEDYARFLEQQIEWATAASQAPLKLDTIDAKLQSFLSVRAYDSIVRKSQSVAKECYLRLFESELKTLLGNHEQVEREFGTAGDFQGDWKVEPRELDEDDLQTEIQRIRRKIGSVEQDVIGLQNSIREKTEQLELIKSQNETLKGIRDNGNE